METARSMGLNELWLLHHIGRVLRKHQKLHPGDSSSKSSRGNRVTHIAQPFGYSVGCMRSMVPTSLQDFALGKRFIG